MLPRLSSFWFCLGLAEFDEESDLIAAIHEFESTLFDLEAWLDASIEAEAADARNNTRTLYFAAKSANKTQTIFSRITGDFYVYHAQKNSMEAVRVQISLLFEPLSLYLFHIFW